MKTITNWAKLVLDFTEIRKLTHFLNQLWVRIGAIALISLVAIAVARVSEFFVPDWGDTVISEDKVSDLLEIIANSMLAITIFSLSVMVTVFRSASSQWTPRVHRLMLDDQTTQNTLATFLGAYLYALASLILIDTDVFEEGQVFVLFLFTVLILALIIVAIVNWIIHLQTLGSLIETTRRIEEQATESFRARMDLPCLGGRRLESHDDVPEDAVALAAYKTGYVQRIYEGGFSEAADEHDVDFYLTAQVGEFVYEGAPVAYVSNDFPDQELLLRDNLILGDLRTFEQDPRFGLIVLGEIGSRALSPGINDPGTAIDVLGRMSRIFENYSERMDDPDEDLPHPRLYVPLLEAADMIEDGFDPIARDGGDVIEVQLALQSALARLSKHPDEILSTAAVAAAKRAFERSETVMQYGRDLERLREATPADVTTDSASAN